MAAYNNKGHRISLDAVYANKFNTQVNCANLLFDKTDQVLVTLFIIFLQNMNHIKELLFSTTKNYLLFVFIMFFVFVLVVVIEMLRI